MDKKKRTIIQVVSTLLQNGNIKGFLSGTIYQGRGKNLCVPGLNCYSCPGAVGSCPIGSLQNALTGYRFKFPFYVLGLLLFFGTLFGRVVCGFLCPFGFVQDLLHKLPFPKKLGHFPGDQILRYLKYGILIILVIVLPICVKLTPFFCKYLCPSGTLAGILLAFSDTSLFSVFGSIFAWKACMLGLILLLSVLIYRPFCKYLCPLGAFYALCNPISLLQMKIDEEGCKHCKHCETVCQMCVNPQKTPNHAECIRCGKCIQACPEKCIHLSIGMMSPTEMKPPAASK